MKRFQLIFLSLPLFICSLSIYFPSRAYAASNQTIEQQINIISNDATSGSSSNGLVLIDTAKYNSATYYFEVIAKVTSGGNGSVDLNYNGGTGAQSNPGSLITINNITANSFTRYRSPAFSPTGAQNANIKNITCTGCTLTIHVARIIIVQSDPVAITDTVTQVDIGEFSTNFTNTSDLPATDSKFWKYDASKYSNVTHIYFETTLQETNPGTGNTAYESLYTAGTSCSSQVSGSEISMAVNNPQRMRSPDLLSVLTSGTTYMVCAHTAPAGKVLEKGARIIIEQSSSSGLTAMEIPNAYSIDKITSTSTTLTGQGYKNLFEVANWSGFTFTYSYQATMKSSNATDTATSQLCYQSSSACDTTIGNNVTTSSTNYGLFVSSSFSQPPDLTELDNGLAISTGGDTITVTKGELIIDVTALPNSNTSTSSLPTPTPTPSANNSGSDPNIKPGWKKKIHAGPKHVGQLTIITAPANQSGSNTGTLIQDNASHIDVFVAIKKQDVVDLISQPTPIPFPWQQGLNTASEIYQYSAVSSFNGYPIQQFDNPVTVILSYDSQKLHGLSPSLLRIAWFDSSKNQWKVLYNNTVINTTNNTIANTVKQFSYFTVVYPQFK